MKILFLLFLVCSPVLTYMHFGYPTFNQHHCYNSNFNLNQKNNFNPYGNFNRFANMKPINKEQSHQNQNQNKEEKAGDKEYWEQLQNSSEHFAIYQSLGVPEQQIKELLSLQKLLQSQIDFYFIMEERASKQRLFYAVTSYFEHLQSVIDTYIGDFDNAALGNNIQITGHDNFIRANNANIKGNENYVMDSKLSQKLLIGSNNMRIGAYQINLNKLEELKTSPRNTIKIFQS